MSQRKTTLCSPVIRSTLQLLACMATVLVVLMICNIPATAAITYEIHDGENQYRLSSNATELSDVLDEAGIDYSDEDLLDSSTKDKVVSVSLTRRHYVAVVCDGVTTSTLASAYDTVADVLSHLNITLGDYDQVSLDPDTLLDEETTVIEVIRGEVSYSVDRTPIPYSSQRQADTELARGEETVTTPGQDGSIVTTYRTITMEDGTTEQEVVSTSTVDPVDEVVSYGTKVEFARPTGYSTTSEYITNIDDEAGTFTTSKGNTYSFTDTLTLNATAYTAGAGALCSTGRLAQVGVVAVDPSYIPYGTQMFIMSADGSFVYGLAVAGDCGGAIDDNDVDLYMTSRTTCINFGRRDVVAYIIDDTESV